jgi:hypothetical protein
MGLKMRQVEFNGYHNVSYGLFDTFVVSFSRYDEVRRIENEKPVDARSRVIASMAVSHSNIFYCDEYGAVTKFEIRGD